ncbi:recombinase family protein [Pseudoalteromonas sp. MEBiC 03485]|uniref:recombinase family protein n=1 Tax=Pseudoalteromonas sp. MEBiC 03485 TaxID=2571103 RepID=UPI001020D5B0|nr:recombinase family protein [Pseudoalteromonas sp. MEBiC 03485]RZD22214.1 recombinase family protein [Pseudoalteromonas sp. MEBiC 03485]RZD22216.1 recombinase family protein [Pseudoalteromonas sp. MEBiC 03485]
MSDDKLSGNVYLYQRFSSQAQEGNSSLYRQGEAQREWLRNHPDCEVVELEGKPLIDAGVSAFSGKHLSSGSLGRLVAAIESKVVPRGSIILVEHFSRLSRMTITETGKLLDKIWDNDISIVTARDQSVYSPSKRNDLSTRMRLIVEIDKAHSDSKWRSEKVKSSWSRREYNAKENKIAPKMRMPFWLDKKGNLNEYADVVRDIFKLHAEGFGQVLIERSLRKKYGDIKPLKNINPTKIIRIIQNPKCIGLVYNEKLYESVVSDKDYYNAQRICKERLFTSVRPDRKWPLHGLVKCGHCGSGMSIQQSAKSLPLLRCSRKQRSGGESCDAPTTFPYVVAYHFFSVYVEHLILAKITDLKRSSANHEQKVKLIHKLKELQVKQADLKEHYRKSEKVSVTIFSLMEDLDAEINDIEAQLSVIQSKIEKSLNLAAISKKIVKLSHSDPLQYNLELNRIGNKIFLKDKELSFSLEENQVIARLKFTNYDRKSKAYKCIFYGSKDYYKESEFVTEVRTCDWDVDRLLKPNRDRAFTAKDAARIFNYSNLYSESSNLDILLQDDE